MGIFKKYGSSIYNTDTFLEYAKKEGSVTSVDINSAIEKNIIEKDKLDYLLNEINSSSIKYRDTVYKKTDKDNSLGKNEGSISLYLKQVGYLKRLTEEEELELWKKLKDCNAQKVLFKDNTQKQEEIDEKINIIRNKLVKSNLRLVISMAKRYYNSCVPFVDIIDEANIGLIESISRFDYTRGFKFSTYAAWWIKQSITKTIANQRDVIRYPLHIARLIKKYINTVKMLAQKLNREPSPKEIAEEMDISLKLLRSISIFSTGTISIESSVNSEGKITNITDFIEDKSAQSPQKQMFIDSLKDTIDEALKELNEKEREIIILRFGLNGNTALTLEKTGEHLNITRERVRQIQEKALKKIRELNLSKELKGFLWD